MSSSTRTDTDNRVFKLHFPFTDPLRRSFFSLMEHPLSRMLSLDHLERVYRDVSESNDGRPFAERALERLNVSYRISSEDRSRLATAGPLIIVANHPFGGIEGLVLAAALGSVRSDVKFMANYLLMSIPEMHDLMIAVDPFRGPGATARNTGPLRACLRWVRAGNTLVVFPAGEVAHFDLRQGRVTDPAWNPAVAKFIRAAGATVLPIYFEGMNSALFHVAGLVHPRLRTLMLPAELLKKEGREVRIRAGAPVTAGKLSACGPDRMLMDHLRFRTFLLKHRREDADSIAHARVPRDKRAAIAPPREPSLLTREVEDLPASQLLHEIGEYAVYVAEAGRIPALLEEIGRLREITFRQAGEGTGKARDLDRFDGHYRHLFIWNRNLREVVGAYRIGSTDELIPRFGAGGLYTSTLFTYRPGFLETLGPALELGRSFIRSEYQKSYAPLLLLWKGIGRFVSANPRYRRLFGPVSITNEYHPLSRRLLVSYLRTNNWCEELAVSVRPRNPFREWSFPGKDGGNQIAAEDLDGLSELIADVECDRKGVPVLLRQYLKLGGRLLGFNRDPDFSDVLDGLIVVDLDQTDGKVLERYLGKDGARTFVDARAACGPVPAVQCA